MFPAIGPAACGLLGYFLKLIEHVLQRVRSNFRRRFNNAITACNAGGCRLRVRCTQGRAGAVATQGYCDAMFTTPVAICRHAPYGGHCVYICHQLYIYKITPCPAKAKDRFLKSSRTKT